MKTEGNMVRPQNAWNLWAKILVSLVGNEESNDAKHPAGEEANSGKRRPGRSTAGPKDDCISDPWSD